MAAKKAGNLPAIYLYEEYYMVLLSLSDEETGKLIKAMILYRQGKEPDLKSERLQGMFDIFKARLDAAEKSYQLKSIRKAYSASQKGKAKDEQESIGEWFSEQKRCRNEIYNIPAAEDYYQNFSVSEIEDYRE